MSGEQHRRTAAREQAAVTEVGRVQDGGDMVSQPPLGARFGGDVHQLERPGGQAVTELGIACHGGGP